MYTKQPHKAKQCLLDTLWQGKVLHTSTPHAQAEALAVPILKSLLCSSLDSFRFQHCIHS